MHLKRVEVENFKSFGRKLTIPFLDGFTAITGPNGSGKSNIGDAILFVLGPKSNKAIRAGRLTDLIFNGGKERKPADHCRVSLVFDNVDRVIPVDTDEVTLMRHVKLAKNNKDNYYSHFYVNGRASSLTEFDSLLAHSRISADGYNIVRQGDVTRIVEMSPLERRRILDDIAGITKFDADITKANEERAQVEANLERIGIILDEIDAQIKKLERERAAALRFKDARDQLDLAKVKLARRRADAITGEIDSVNRQMTRNVTEIADLEKALGVLREDIVKADDALKKVESEIAERGGEEARELKIQIDALKAQQVRATERLNYAKQELGDIKAERAEVQEALKRLDKDEAKIRRERDGIAERQKTASAERTTAAAHLDALRNRIGEGQGKAAEMKQELAKLKQKYDAAQEEIHAAKLEEDRLAEKRDHARTAVADLEEKKQTAAFELKDAEWELKELTGESQGSQTDLERMKKDLFANKKRESEVTAELRDLETAVRRLRNDYQQLKTDHDAAENAARGYTRAVDAVMTARDQGELPGVIGTIAELAKVDDKYGTAMEVAAGGRMQAIVTETDADAAAAIDYLKAKKLGRATFLPLSRMTPGRPAGRPLMAVRDNAAEGFAIDLIQYEDRYKPAFWYVFRDTVIMRDLTNARRLMGGVRMVTLDGDVIDAGGAMTGGHDARREKLKFGAGATREELDRVAKRLRAAVEHQEILAGELAQVRATIEALDGEIRTRSQDATSKGDRVKALENRKREAHARLEVVSKDLARVNEEFTKAESVLQEIVGRRSVLTTTLETFEAERKEKNTILLSSTDRATAEDLTRTEAKVSELRESVRDADSQLETKDHAIALVAERRAEIEATLKRLADARGEHDERMKESAKEIAKANEQLEVFLKVEAEQNEEMRGLHKERDTAYEAKSQLQNKASKVEDKIETTRDLGLQLKMKIPGLEDALKEVQAELDAAPVPAPDVVEETQEALRGEIRRLDNEIARIGDVNLLALEQYDDQVSRKTQLSTEVERLNGERENLIELVDALTDRKKEGFFKVFEEINEHFQSVFARLSDGGKARLELEHPDDPFEGGLILRSQPKGKKVTRLEALSGGEKSLTSMAFIFAIQEFTPSPFYYLDEVDQNLDGINSELLARMVKANSRTSQVIMVSLRKVTLKEASHVYGVTMNEGGLSEVVGEVHLSEIPDADQGAPKDEGGDGEPGKVSAARQGADRDGRREGKRRDGGDDLDEGDHGNGDGDGDDSDDGDDGDAGSREVEVREPKAAPEVAPIPNGGTH